MKIFQSSFFWFSCFTVFFILSLDFWSWEQEKENYFSIFHLPSWVLYFVILQLFMAFALYMFAIHFWDNKSE